MPTEGTEKHDAIGSLDHRPRIDLQHHLADLDAAGLIYRVERPINKDTELHPLVRWQFQGGIPEEERRAFLFTNVVDSKGPQIRHAGGARARSRPRGGSTRWGWAAGRRDRQRLDQGNREADPAGSRRLARRSAGHHQGRGSEAERAVVWRVCRCRISTPGFDAAPYLTATLCITRDPETCSRTWACIARP